MSRDVVPEWPPAGSWIRRHYPKVGWATTRWHRFTGDAIWRLPWPGPSLETLCGYRTGPMWALADLSIAGGEPDEPCRLCLARERTTGRARADSRGTRKI